MSDIKYDDEMGLATAAEQIPAKRAQIYWDRAKDGRVSRTAVVARPDDEDQAGFASLQALDSKFMCCSGAAEADWLSLPPKWPMTPVSRLTPPGQFGVFLRWGFASPEAQREALYEFSKISGCKWAQRMLYAIDVPD